MEKIQSDSSEKSTETESFQELYDSFLSKALKSKEFSDLMDPMVERIDENQVASINESFLFYNDCRNGYRELVDLLAGTLGIEAPNIFFKTVSEEEKSKYPPAIYDDKKKCIGIVLSDGESYWGTGKIIGPVKKIAHEMWHAYQHNEIDRHGIRASIYQDNFDNYIRANRNSSNEDILAYLEQPIEVEAYVFGEKFTLSFVEKLISSLTKERDNFIGKTALGNSIGTNRDDEDEEFFNSERELKMEQLSRLQNIYNDSRFAKLTKK